MTNTLTARQILHFYQQYRQTTHAYIILYCVYLRGTLPLLMILKKTVQYINLVQGDT